MQNNTSMQILEKLERRILAGLSCEWEHTLYVLPSELARKMKKPIFGLKPMGDRLGAWYGENLEICLNLQFVMTHPWDSVREVLIHEMAHQLAEQLLHGADEPAHGKTFQEACRLLRANPKASGRYPTLYQRLWEKSRSREDRIMVRVQKLLALSESSNRHEAESAMLKASELIQKHNLHLLERKARRDFISVFLDQPALRHTRDQYHLARLLQEFYCVEGIWVSAFVLDKGKMGRALEISGTRQNVQTASYVWDYVRRFIDAQWRGYDIAGRLGRFRKTDFAAGLIEGFRETLRDKSAIRSTVQEHQDLVAVQDPLLKRYIANRYPAIRVSRGRITKEDPSVVAAGERVGRRMVIPKGIPDGAADSPPRLPGRT